MFDAWSFVVWGKVPFFPFFFCQRPKTAFFSPNVNKQRIAFSVLVY